MRVNIAELVSTDIRSRYNGNILRAAIDGEEGRITFDFSGVTFISRSFADELYNIINENKNVTVANMCDFVSTMYDTVVKGRTSRRRDEHGNSQMLEFKNMESLSKYLKTF